MKKLIVISLGLLVAGCTSAPQQYEDTITPAPRDFRIEEPQEPDEPHVEEPKGEEEFISANGEVCSVINTGSDSKAICKSGDSTTEVESIISGSI
jgi:hypothetical protein